MEADGLCRYAFAFIGLAGLGRWEKGDGNMQLRKYVFPAAMAAGGLCGCRGDFILRSAILSDFRLNLLAKFLAYAIVALGS